MEFVNKFEICIVFRAFDALLRKNFEYSDDSVFVLVSHPAALFFVLTKKLVRDFHLAFLYKIKLIKKFRII